MCIILLTYDYLIDLFRINFELSDFNAEYPLSMHPALKTLPTLVGLNMYNKVVQ